MNPRKVLSTHVNGWRYMLEKKFSFDKYNTTSPIVRPGRSVISRLMKDVQDSQIIVFDTEQVKVFWDLIRVGKFLPTLDYRLPFPKVCIYFSEPIILQEADYFGLEIGHQAVFLTQESLLEGIQLKDVVNRIAILHREYDPVFVEWFGNLPEVYEVVPPWSADIDKLGAMYRSLAAACVEYINCENIYLEKQGEVPEAVNSKREKKGKSRLEPYYVCRIRGVQYDSTATGEGSKHGIRYDVRGHFRRLTTGKTIWVRPHQRGLTNELYIPKVYQVDKGVKDHG